MKGLTKRQREIVDYIKTFIDSNGYSPSYREIGGHFRFSSIGSVYNHIKVLKRKGAIDTEPHARRSINIPHEKPTEDTTSSSIEIPFIGYVSANESIDTFPLIQTITIHQSLIPSPHQTYAFRVRGDSLIGELISDGDLILVEVNSNPQAGDIIIGSLPSQKTFIKRYFPEGNHVRLESRAPSIEPLSVRTDDVSIRGTIVALIRIY